MHTGPSKDIKEVEGFEDAFKDLGQFVFSVGLKLATACEPFGVPTIVFHFRIHLNGFHSGKALVRSFFISRSVNLQTDDESTITALLPAVSRKSLAFRG